MAFNDIYRLRVYQRLHGQQVVNVMHFVQEDPLSTVGGQQLANNFIANMTTTMRARTSNQMTYEYVEVQTIVPFSGGPVTANWTGGTAGTQIQPCQTGTVAEVITIYTSRGGRRGRGRIFLAGARTDTTGMASGLWAAAQTTLTQAYATALATFYTGVLPPVPFHLGVWSKASGPALPPWTSSQFVRATGLTVRQTVRNQRRRQIGVGR